MTFDQTVETLLATCRTASLATADEHGMPHAANVQVVHDQRWRLIWVSAPDARHSLDLAQRPDAAITVYAHDDRPEQIHGLQIRGRVTRLHPGPGWDDAWERYVAKFPFVAQSERLTQAVRRQAFYQFTPNWVRLIDNREHFGFKVERTLADRSEDAAE